MQFKGKTKHFQCWEMQGVVALGDGNILINPHYFYSGILITRDCFIVKPICGCGPSAALETLDFQDLII